MTKTELRDYFAAKAMAAYMAIYYDNLKTDNKPRVEDGFIAELSYLMADEMLIQRVPFEKRKPKKFNHVACPAYPNCDEDPMGCRLEMGDDVEEYGMRD